MWYIVEKGGADMWFVWFMLFAVVGYGFSHFTFRKATIAFFIGLPTIKRIERKGWAVFKKKAYLSSVAGSICCLLIGAGGIVFMCFVATSVMTEGFICGAFMRVLFWWVDWLKGRKKTPNHREVLDEIMYYECRASGCFEEWSL